MTPFRPPGSLAIFSRYSIPWRFHLRACLSTSQGTLCSRSYLAATGRMTSSANLWQCACHSSCSSFRPKSTRSPPVHRSGASLTDQSTNSRIPACACRQSRRYRGIAVLRPLAVLLVAALIVALCGCSGRLNEKSGTTRTGTAPTDISAKSTSKSAAAELGFPVTATKNTTRVAGADTVADVAGVVSAVFPATSADNRPHAVAIVDKSSWQGAIAASVLMSKPLAIPVLLSDGGKLPSVSSDTLKRLKPAGSPLARNAQVIRIGDGAAQPTGYRTAVIPGADAYAVASGIDRFFSVARGKPGPNVVVTTGEQAGFAMPAAAWAPRSGDSVLFVTRDTVPQFTRTALK